MGLIYKLSDILTKSREEYEKILRTKEAPAFSLVKSVGENKNSRLYYGDNGACMRDMLAAGDFAEKFKLIYIDPPFNSKANYDAVINVNLEADDGKKNKVSLRHRAYEDSWDGDSAEYLEMLAVRLFFMKDLLKEDGTIWVHLDWHSSHYVKLLMDEIFGEENFINEIIWQYKSGGSSNRHFARKHDTILVYGKTKKYYIDIPKEKSYNRGYKAYKFKDVQEYEDELGWYTLVNMKDVWTLDMVGRTSSERNGYATQKPESLLRRIVLAATEEGDLCGDFFSGSGTLAKTAAALGRDFVVCDKGKISFAKSYERLKGNGFKEDGCSKGGFQLFVDKSIEMSKAKVDWSAKVLRNIEDDEIQVETQINAYELKAYEEEIDKRDLQTAEKIIKDNPISLIQNWEIDVEPLEEDQHFKIRLEILDVLGNYTIEEKNVEL